MAWFVKTIKFANGERYPFLLSEEGVPEYWATLFVTTQMRSAGNACSTMEAALHSVRLLYAWASFHGIALTERLSAARFLTDPESESLAAFLQRRADDRLKQCPSPRKPRHSKVVILERAYGGKTPTDKGITNQTLYSRITYAANYLNWLAYKLLGQRKRFLTNEERQSVEQMTVRLKILRPKHRKSSRIHAPRGLDQDEQKLLSQMLSQYCAQNPFSTEVQLRNRLIVTLMTDLGIRSGELLSIKVDDFDFTSNTLVIPRRHDDPDDPRNNQPVAKTLDRRLPISSQLAEDVVGYVTKDRMRVKQQPDHGFLFVSHKLGPNCGRPLSQSGLRKIFEKLRTESEGTLENLTPHALRHTANENFSSLMDQKNVSEAREKKLRAYMMGWVETSDTVSTYTRRHIEKEAREASLQMQKSLRVGSGNGKPEKPD